MSMLGAGVLLGMFSILATFDARAQSDAVRFDHAIAFAAKGNMTEALPRLDKLPDSVLTERQRSSRDCITSRFRSAAIEKPADESLPSVATRAIDAYRRYWTAVMLGRAKRDAADRELSEALGVLVPEAPAALDDRIGAVQRRLEAAGLNAYMGHKPPLRELMIWRSQSKSRETVALPDGPTAIDVIMLDDFVSLGWQGWTTCDLRYSAAWAIDGGTMVVAKAWERTAESYSVSLLAHEAQHVRDHRSYPKLSQPDLEFRGKLVELALAERSQPHLLSTMTTESRKSRNLPHPFANYWVVERLRGRLGTRDLASAKPDMIRLAAREELRRHSNDLDSLGRETAVTALPD